MLRPSQFRKSEVCRLRCHLWKVTWRRICPQTTVQTSRSLSCLSCPGRSDRALLFPTSGRPPTRASPTAAVVSAAGTSSRTKFRAARLARNSSAKFSRTTLVTVFQSPSDLGSCRDIYASAGSAHPTTLSPASRRLFRATDTDLPRLLHGIRWQQVSLECQARSRPKGRRSAQAQRRLLLETERNSLSWEETILARVARGKDFATAWRAPVMPEKLPRTVAPLPASG